MIESGKVFPQKVIKGYVMTMVEGVILQEFVLWS